MNRSDEWKLMQKLFSNYSKDLRPSTPVKISLDIAFVNLDSVVSEYYPQFNIMLQIQKSNILITTFPLTQNKHLREMSVLYLFKEEIWALKICGSRMLNHAKSPYFMFP